MIGVVGNDNPAKILEWLLREKGIAADGLLYDTQRPTTVKTRIIAHNQQVVRADRELKKDISRELQDEIMDRLENRAEALKGLISRITAKALLPKRFSND